MTSKNECVAKALEVAKENNNKITVNILRKYTLDNTNLYYLVQKYWGGITEFKKEFGINTSREVYKKEDLINILKNFYNDYGIVPSSTFMEKYSQEYGLPSRKTFENKIGKRWYEILKLCGLNPDAYGVAGNSHDGSKNVIHDDKDFLINIIYEYIDKYNKVPTIREINEYYGTELKNFYKKHFGGWNNCLKSLGLKLNSVSRYTDDELRDYFMDFVKEYNRVPTIQDFNGTGRPSFWVYQNKFGSWAEACIHYGFKPNCREEKYYMSDGERCDSSYEYDISVWLKSHNIVYRRDVSYTEVDKEYRGKMNCDYVFELNDGQIWYVEMAGFINTYDFTKYRSRAEELYYFKIKYKEKLLKRNNVNYRIITVDDIKHKSLYEIFDFLCLKEAA